MSRPAPQKPSGTEQETLSVPWTPEGDHADRDDPLPRKDAACSTGRCRVATVLTGPSGAAGRPCVAARLAGGSAGVDDHECGVERGA